jgi:hypothetical protein
MPRSAERISHPHKQAVKPAMNKPITTINITNKQTKDAAAAVSFLQTTTRHYTMDTLHCHLPTHLPTHAHPSRSNADATDANAANTRLRANRPTP